MTDAELAAAVARFTWMQSLRLRHGVLTAGAVSEAQLLAEEDALLGPVPLEGLDVLEVGAGNGHFSFAARLRGAARVVTTDHLAWTLPGAAGEAATRLAATALGLPLETRVLDPRSLIDGRERFHVVIAPGFFERQWNPIAALRGIRAACTRLLLIETRQEGGDEPRPIMTALDTKLPFGATLSGWAPNPPLVLTLLHSLGFDRILYRNHPTLGPARGIYAAFAPDPLLKGFGQPWIDMTHPYGIPP